MSRYGEFVSPYFHLDIVGSLTDKGEGGDRVRSLAKATADLEEGTDVFRTYKIERKIEDGRGGHYRVRDFVETVSVETTLLGGLTTITVGLKLPYNDAIVLFKSNLFDPAQLLLLTLGYGYGTAVRSFAGITGPPKIEYAETIGVTLTAYNLSVLDLARGRLVADVKKDAGSDPTKKTAPSTKALAYTVKPSPRYAGGAQTMSDPMSAYDIVKDILEQSGSNMQPVTEGEAQAALHSDNHIFFYKAGRQTTIEKQETETGPSAADYMDKARWVQRPNESEQEMIQRVCKSCNVSPVFGWGGRKTVAFFESAPSMTQGAVDKLAREGKIFAIFRWMGDLQPHHNSPNQVLPLSRIEMESNAWWAVAAAERLKVPTIDPNSGFVDSTLIAGLVQDGDKDTSGSRKTDKDAESGGSKPKGESITTDISNIPTGEKRAYVFALPSSYGALASSMLSLYATIKNPTLKLLTMGLPDIDLGGYVAIEGTNISFLDKYYYVTGYVHTFQSDGFKTALTLVSDVLTNNLTKTQQSDAPTTEASQKEYDLASADPIDTRKK